MHVVSTNQIIDILHFNDKDCYLPFFGLISPGQIDKTMQLKQITREGTIKNTQTKSAFR